MIIYLHCMKNILGSIIYTLVSLVVIAAKQPEYTNRLTWRKDAYLLLDNLNICVNERIVSTTHTWTIQGIQGKICLI